MTAVDAQSPVPAGTVVRRGGPRRLPGRSAQLWPARLWSVLVSALLATGVGLVVLAGPAASPAAAASRCGSTVPPGQVRVVVVVDPGDGGSPGVTCLVVPEGTKGGKLLFERSGVLGTTSPRFADSGLLCAIDGFPAQECGQRTEGGYRYWSYWSGTSGSWVYGNGNPFSRPIRDGDIEGWRFVDGAGSGGDPAPRVSPSTSLFPALAPPPTVAPPAPGPDERGPVAPGAGGGAGAPTGGLPSPTTAAGAAPAVEPDPAADADATTTESTATAPTDATGTTGDTSEVQELAVMPASTTGGSGGALAGVVAVVALTVGIGTAAVVQAHRRRAEGT